MPVPFQVEAKTAVALFVPPFATLKVQDLVVPVVSSVQTGFLGENVA